MLGTPAMHYEQEQKFLENFHAKICKIIILTMNHKKASITIVNTKFRKHQDIANNNNNNNNNQCEVLKFIKSSYNKKFSLDINTFISSQ